MRRGANGQLAAGPCAATRPGASGVRRTTQPQSPAPQAAGVASCGTTKTALSPRCGAHPSRIATRARRGPRRASSPRQS
eukprot:scaffold38781_cov63-Phaeocystis_antarctica.AAC.1